MMTNETKAPERIWFNDAVLQDHMHVSFQAFVGGRPYVPEHLYDARIAKLEMDCRSYKAMAADAIHRMDAKQATIAELEERNTALGEAVAYATQRFTKAENALGKIALGMELTQDEMQRIARATLAELKGEIDE